MSSDAKMNILKKKTFLIPVIIVLILAIAAGIYFVYFWSSAKKVTIASRTDIIRYFDSRGITEYLNEKYNIKISWVDYGEEGAFEMAKANIGKDAPSVPDAYLGLGLDNQQMKSLAPELFLDLSGSLAGTPTLNGLLNTDKNLQNQITTEGKIYSFPSYYEDYAGKYPQKMWINSQWLDKVGAQMPTTPDELYEVLVKFKNQDPNGNGKADEIPLGCAYLDEAYSSLGFIVSAFIPTEYDLTDKHSIFDVDAAGGVYTTVTDQRFKTALMYINRLVGEGLIASDVFRTDKAKLVTGSPYGETLAAGDVHGEIYGMIACSDINGIFNDVSRASKYEAVAPIYGGNVSTVVKTPRVEMGGLYISKYSKNITEMLSIGDEMLTPEGTLTVMFGKKGTDWTDADAGAAAMGADAVWWKLISDKAVEKPFANYGGVVPMWYSSSLILSRQAVSGAAGETELKSPGDWEGYLNKMTRERYEPVADVGVKYTLPEMVFTAEQEAQISQAGIDRGELYSYIVDSCRGFAIGSRSFDLWDEYVETLNTMGIEKFRVMVQNAYGG